MSYSLAKVLHLAAVAIWLAGMLWQSWDLTFGAARRGAGRGVGTWRLTQGVVLPAMVLTWVLGVHLAFRGGWFGANWLWVKLGLALSLSAVCLAQSVALWRRARGGDRRGPGAARLAGAWIIIAAAAAIALALRKPF